jgi:hypothetical protein
VTPTITQTWTYSPTPIPEPYGISITIFNSAGELVKTLYQGLAQNSPSGLNTGGANTLATGGGQQLAFIFPGYMQGLTQVNGSSTLYWNGTNNSSQTVTGGTYYVSLQVTDPFGHVKAYTLQVSVVAVQMQVSLTVYNSAGEAVAHLPLSATSALGVGTSLLIPQPVKALQASGSAGSGNAFQIELVGAGGTTTIPWDGLNDSGMPVSPGNYTVELSSQQVGGSVTREDKEVVVLEAPASQTLGSPYAAPQPWHSGPLYVYFSAVAAADPVRARVYTAAGELAAEAWAQGGDGRVSIRGADNLASGIYLVDLSWLHGSAVLERRTIKMAVTH